METAVFTNISAVCSVSGECMGVRKGERKEAKSSFGKTEVVLRSSENLQILPIHKCLFSQGKFRTQLVAFSQK